MKKLFSLNILYANFSRIFPAYKRANTGFKEVTFPHGFITEAYNTLKQLREEYYRRTDMVQRNIVDRSYQDLQDYARVKSWSKSSIIITKPIWILFIKEKPGGRRFFIESKFPKCISGITGNLLKSSYFEYHSLNTGDLLESERIHKAINTVIFEERMAETTINAAQVEKLLKPVILKKYRLRAKGSREFDFYIEFYGSLIGIILLYMAIFTAGGFLFSGIIQEKNKPCARIIN